MVDPKKCLKCQWKLGSDSKPEELCCGKTFDWVCIRFMNSCPLEMAKPNIIGERIKQVRKEKKISQDQLAKKLNYADGNTVMYWEHGKHPVPEDQIEAIAKILKVSVDYLVGKTDGKKEAL